MRHLLAHSAGYDFADRTMRYRPGDRRLYSNAGFEVLGRNAGSRPPAWPSPSTCAKDCWNRWAWRRTTPGGLPRRRRRLHRRGPGAAGRRTAAAEAAGSVHTRHATSVVFPGLAGVLPGFGRQQDNDWGLGFELRDAKSPHWTGANSSPRTFGHFGQSGTFLWVDPDAAAACVVLTDRGIRPVGRRGVAVFTDGVLAELAHRG